MNRQSLSNFQTEILLLAYEGKSNRQIAAATGEKFNCIVTTFSNIKRAGYRLPAHRPLDATAERELERQERREQRAAGRIAGYTAAPRFSAMGVKVLTGERFEVTSDTQAFADAHLAAMLGVRDG